MGSPWEPLLYAFAGVILAMVLVIVFPVCCRVSRVEGFQTTKKNTIPCPKGSKSYTDMAGNTMCCKGTINGNTCDNPPLCTLSGNNTRDLPTCKRLRDMKLAELQRQCPPSMRAYHDDQESGQTGCANQINSDQTAPLNPATNYCRIYGDNNDLYEMDSCKHMANSALFTTSFKSAARPNFCMDVNGFDSRYIGMAPCNGSDGQLFAIQKNMIFNKKGFVSPVSNGVLIIPRTQALSGGNFVGITKVPHENGGFLLKSENTGKCIGLPNGDYTDPRKDKNAKLATYECNPIKNPNIVWNSTKTTKTSKGVNTPAPPGYRWQCNVVKI